MNSLHNHLPINPDEQNEREKRLAAFNFARGSVRLEGFVLSDDAIENNMQYIDGKISAKDRILAIDKKYKRCL